ncbi:YchJ family protein [Neptunicella marina]|uniref:Zinc chelation protein SecC n=1 Tax=Neptunicella marina TaxID=2125989 RepID=A0A8J6IPF9_9ALTE|nr:YchJ family metal-binding protein [Neptunicella marina]MBC3764264.1 zinc chelation protein SecC [Neptunicella marina]
MQCFCGSGNKYQVCCSPLVEEQQSADNPEALMRSRYSAYVVKQYQYIFNTYSAKHPDRPLSVDELREHANGTTWLGLKIEKTSVAGDTGEVEFRAMYQVDNQLYQLHELSQFIKENHQWRYLSGRIFDDSGRL